MTKEATLHQAEILCVGTELLLGEVTNTNGAEIARALAECGIDVYRSSVVGDNTERLTEAIRTALSACDLLVMCGGLGPTSDDITRDVCAAVMGLPLYENAEVYESIVEYFLKKGMRMPENNRRQTMVPEGAQVLENRYGTAPGLICVSRDGEKTVVLLPGPPRELVPMLREQVVPYLKERTTSVITSKNLYLFGMSESAVDEALQGLAIKKENLTVAAYVNGHDVRIRVTAKSNSKPRGRIMCDSVIKKIKASSIGKHIYGDDVSSLEEAVVRLLKEKKKTFALAETCTGGLCAKRIVDISGASEVFYGSMVCYSPLSKHNLLGVSKHTLEAHTEVSRQAVVQMAESVRNKFGTDIGVAVVGYAGPGGGTEEKPIGTVYLAYSERHHDTLVYKFNYPDKGRDYIRSHSASRVFSVILERNR